VKQSRFALLKATEFFWTRDQRFGNGGSERGLDASAAPFCLDLFDPVDYAG